MTSLRKNQPEVIYAHQENVMSINRLKQLTEQLAESESQERLADLRLRTALQVSGAGLWDWEVEPDILRWDDRMVDLFGYGSKEFERDGHWHLATYAHFINRVHQDDRHATQKKIDRCLINHIPYSTKYRVVRPDNTEVTLILAAGDKYEVDGERRLVGVCLPSVVEGNDPG
tara:strand:+ start:825 stop:1340 length:516 start_codon:yes stop_codon:yes gene_type:complete